VFSVASLIMVVVMILGVSWRSIVFSEVLMVLLILVVLVMRVIMVSSGMVLVMGLVCRVKVRNSVRNFVNVCRVVIVCSLRMMRGLMF